MGYALLSLLSEIQEQVEAKVAHLNLVWISVNPLTTIVLCRIKPGEDLGPRPLLMGSCISHKDCALLFRTK